MAIKVSPQLARMGVATLRNETLGPGRSALVAYNRSGILIPGMRFRGESSWNDKIWDVAMSMAHVEAAVPLYEMTHQDDPSDRTAIEKDLEINAFQSQTPKAFARFAEAIGSGKFGQERFSRLGTLLEKGLLPIQQHDDLSPAFGILDILAQDRAPLIIERSGRSNSAAFNVFRQTPDIRLLTASVQALLQSGNYDAVKNGLGMISFVATMGIGAFAHAILPLTEKGLATDEASRLLSSLHLPFSLACGLEKMDNNVFKLIDDAVLDCVYKVGSKITAEDIAKLCRIKSSDVRRALDYLESEGMINNDGDGNYSPAE